MGSNMLDACMVDGERHLIKLGIFWLVYLINCVRIQSNTISLQDVYRYKHATSNPASGRQRVFSGSTIYGRKAD